MVSEQPYLTMIEAGGGTYPLHAFSESGAVAFYGDYRNWDGEGRAFRGVLRVEDGQITPIARDGAGEGPNGRFYELQRSLMRINDRGNVLFMAGEVPGVSYWDRQSLFVHDDRLGVVRVVGPGDVVAGRRVESVGDRGLLENFDVTLNERGQVVYHVMFENDGGSAVLLWDLPDPADGDADLDGAVTIADFAVLRSNFGGGGPLYFVDGDFDGDRAVTIADFALLRANFGGSAAEAAELDAWAAAAVPEPAALAPAAAAAGFLLRRRR